MSEQTLSETAREQFPTTYHGNLVESDPKRQPLNNVDEAYKYLQERKEGQPEKSGKKIARAVKKSDADATEYQEAQDEVTFTDDDARTQREVQKEFSNLQSAIAVWSHFHSQIPEIEKTDKARAAELKQDSLAAQKELYSRWNDLGSLSQELQKKQWRANVIKERKKLNRELPYLDTKQLRDYLLNTGFNRQEVDSEVDHRLIVMAEKARQWDEHVSGSNKKPKPRVRVVKNAEPKQKPNNIAALEENLRKRGTIDAAYELLEAKRRAS